MQSLGRVLTLAAVLAAIQVPHAGAIMFGPAPTAIRDHDPAELRAAGIVPWDVLKELEISYETKGPGMTSFTQSFTTELKELDGKEVKFAGFIYPTEAGEQQTSFLLSAYPPNCPFCLPGGATDMVQVETATPVRFTQEAIILAGRFELLRDDPRACSIA